MASAGYLEVALVELYHAEVAALRAQQALQKMVNAGLAGDADKQAFGVIAAQLFGIEQGLYGQIVGALPSEVASHIPMPTLLTLPTPAPLGNPAIPPIVVWAAVVLAVLLAIVAAVAVVYTITISIETISQIILTYRAADSYATALQQRVQVINACIAAGRTAAECTAAAQSIILPAPVQPPAPPIPPNPNTPWYMAASVVGGLGALALGLWFLERRGSRKALGGSVIDLRQDNDDGGLEV